MSLRLTTWHENGGRGAVGAGLVPAQGAHKGRPYAGCGDVFMAAKDLRSFPVAVSGSNYGGPSLRSG